MGESRKGGDSEGSVRGVRLSEKTRQDGGGGAGKGPLSSYRLRGVAGRVSGESGSPCCARWRTEAHRMTASHRRILASGHPSPSRGGGGGRGKNRSATSAGPP